MDFDVDEDPTQLAAVILFAHWRGSSRLRPAKLQINDGSQMTVAIMMMDLLL